jgi:uncharacterized protein (DUF2235 family)
VPANQIAAEQQGSKNIVLLSDGTGNSAGKLQKTNVWRLYDALILPHRGAPDPPQQIAYYDDGVGSSSFRPYALLGGAIGLGLKRNVIDLYTFLCWNYRPGDRIYAFGFSRGAFTIRVLVGLVNNQGLVQAATWDELKGRARDAYRRYRRRYRSLGPIHAPARAVRDALYRVPPKEKVDHIESPPITFVGLWDTVSAYGLPFDELTRAWNFIMPLSVPDRELCGNVERACHALALDEERQTFQPVLWNEESLPNEDHIHKERLTQVWFPGVHSNVGGGYPDDGLANVPLFWIMSEAARLGLLVKPVALNEAQRSGDIYGKLYDPRRGLGGFYRYLPRKIARLTKNQNPWRKNDKVIIARPKIHESAFQRIAHNAAGYAPIGLPPRYAVVANDGVIHDMPAAVLPSVVREHPPEGTARALNQERVWDLVWCRRVLYFFSVAAALFLVLFPLLFPALPSCRQPLCSTTPLIDALAFVLPNFTSPLLRAYSTNPLEFWCGVIALAVLIWVSSRVQNRIEKTMYGIWAGGPSTNAAAPGGLYAIRESGAYRWFWRHMQQTLLPGVLALVILWLIAAGVSQVVFAMRNAAGGFCKNSPTVNKEFSTRELCWASGIPLEKGVRYRITLTINEPWRDGVFGKPGDQPIDTDLLGFGFDKTTWKMYFGLPFRRYLTEKWFKPIARIGNDGTDEHVLEHGDILIDNRSKTLITEITARSDGQLFLFVNDSVFFAFAQQSTYKNNRGTASVTVVPMEPSHRLREQR